MEACACGILRASESSSENVCSAVEMVFPPGVFMTTMPRSVAAATSTLSTPTPARPTTAPTVIQNGAEPTNPPPPLPCFSS